MTRNFTRESHDHDKEVEPDPSVHRLRRFLHHVVIAVGTAVLFSVFVWLAVLAVIRGMK